MLEVKILIYLLGGHNSTHTMAAWPLLVAVKVGKELHQRWNLEVGFIGLANGREGNRRAQAPAFGKWVDVVLFPGQGSLDRKG